MGRKWSVRQLLQTLLILNTLAVLLVGIIGALAVRETTRTVDNLSQELSPAQQSNARFMEAMLDCETELRAFLISGEKTQLADYRAALELAPKVEVELHAYAEDDPEMATLVATLDRAAKAWVRDFATEAIRSGGGPGSYRPTLYELGVRRFDAIKDVNRKITSKLQAEVVDARAAAQDTMSATLGLMALIGLLAALGCSVLGWWALRSIRRPLSALEETVDRLATGQREARAPDVGPTEIRRLGVALNELAEENARVRDLELHMQQQLMEVDRAKSEFVSNVSHELRTPLTSISGYLELLEESLEDQVDANQAEMLAITQRNVGRLYDLIEDLLALSSAERLPEHLDRVSVLPLVDGVVKDLRFSAGSRGVTISVDAAQTDPGPVVLADAAQLHRAILNLVSNAVKFSRAGGEVRLFVDASDDEVEVRVIDHGIGIPSSDQLKLGERFYRASNAVAEQIPGTGLGLRMVQSIVNNHHGSFTVASVEGQGTTATLRLPLKGPAGDLSSGEQTTAPRR
jgi:two-component system OmpR family sensor kinase